MSADKEPMPIARASGPITDVDKFVRGFLLVYPVGSKMEIHGLVSRSTVTIDLLGETPGSGYHLALRGEPLDPELRFSGTGEECARWVKRVTATALPGESKTRINLIGRIDPIKAELPGLLEMERSSSRILRAFARWRIKRIMKTMEMGRRGEP